MTSLLDALKRLETPPRPTALEQALPPAHNPFLQIDDEETAPGPRNTIATQAEVPAATTHAKRNDVVPPEVSDMPPAIPVMATIPPVEPVATPTTESPLPKRAGESIPTDTPTPPVRSNLPPEFDSPFKARTKQSSNEPTRRAAAPAESATETTVAPRISAPAQPAQPDPHEQMAPADRERLTAPVSLRKLLEPSASSGELIRPASTSATTPRPAPVPPPASTLTMSPAASHAGEPEPNSETAEDFASLLPPPEPSRSFRRADPEAQESLLRVCDRLFARLPREDRAIVAFTSVSIDEAQPLAVTELAAAMAGELDDPVLVIDATDRMQISRDAGIRSAARLDELAVERYCWRDLVVQTTTPGLCILAICVDEEMTPDPSTVARLLNEIADRYPCVLIDVGQLSTATSASLLAACDGKVVTIERGFTPVEAAISALHLPAPPTSTVLGTLLIQRRGK